MKKLRDALFVIPLLAASCGTSTQTALPTVTIAPATQTLVPIDTSIPATATAAPPTDTPIPIPTQDPAVFGEIGINEIQAFVLESVANAIFVKVMDGFVVSGAIQEYQVTSITIFPGGNGLISEIMYNVKTTDVSWLTDGGTQSADGWINGNCSRFDFFTTDTEYQLKNRRLCG